MARLDAFELVARGLPADPIEAALVIAKDEYPDLDIHCYLEQMQVLNEGFDIFRNGETAPGRLLEMLGDFFYAELGFSGNQLNYYDARNSYLNDVLDRRLGIPISLAMPYRAVARSAGIELEAVGFPGHFLLRWRPDAQRTIYVDVFEAGKLLTWQECLRRLPTENDGSLDEREFEALSDAQVLLRMLRNLKSIYARGDFDRCLRVQKRIARLCEQNVHEQRDLGLLYYHAGKPALAMQHLESLIRKFPECANEAPIRRYLAASIKEAIALN